MSSINGNYDSYQNPTYTPRKLTRSPTPNDQALNNYFKEKSFNLNKLCCFTCTKPSWMLGDSGKAFDCFQIPIDYDSDISGLSSDGSGELSEYGDSTTPKIGCATYTRRAACITCEACKAMYQENIIRAHNSSPIFDETMQ